VKQRIWPLILIGFFTLACDDERQETEIEQCESYCTVGSGFPCSCDPTVGCADGSTCGATEPGDAMGICLPPCESDADCSTHLPCDAVPRCMMVNNETGELHCGYACDFDEECPKNMFCRGGEGDGVCSPLL
jgi:hypothetical protein